MADPGPRQPIIAEQRQVHGPGDAACLTALPPACRFIFRGSPAAAAVAGNAFGSHLLTDPCRASQSNGRAALWLGPDEWLLIAAENDAAEIKTALSAALGDTPYALIGVGHRNAGLAISGPRAAAVLNAGCPLDLHESAFPAGMCTRTMLGKSEIILWRTLREEFHIDVWRSFAPYVWDFLLEARARL